MVVPHFIYPTVYGHLGCFYFSAIENATTNIYVQVFAWTCGFSSLRSVLRKRVIRSHCNSVLNTLKKYRLFFVEAAIFHSPDSNVQGFQFLHVLANTCYSPFWGSSHPGECKVVSHVVLVCLSLQTNDVQFTGHLYSFLAEMSIQIVHFKIRLFVFLLLSCESFL